jgi:hypothetical protein
MINTKMLVKRVSRNRLILFLILTAWSSIYLFAGLFGDGIYLGLVIPGAILTAFFLFFT